MAEAKKKKIENVNNNVCQGKRIVDIQELGKNLKCCKCKEVLSLEKITNEKHYGLHSVFTITCNKCEISTIVHTGKVNTIEDQNYCQTKMSAVLGKVFLLIFIMNIINL